MSDLRDVITRLIGREGAYSNNPADRGGETIWGITANVARANGYTGAMAAMSRETAEGIYTNIYWAAPGFDRVAVLSPVIAEELLDTGVNMGPRVAVVFLQRALTVLNRRGKDYPDLLPDGSIGPQTLAALKAFLTVRGMAGVTVLLRMLDAQQCVRYIAIAETDDTQEDFVFGWVSNRIGGAYGN